MFVGQKALQSVCCQGSAADKLCTYLLTQVHLSVLMNAAACAQNSSKSRSCLNAGSFCVCTKAADTLMSSIRQSAQLTCRSCLHSARRLCKCRKEVAANACIRGPPQLLQVMIVVVTLTKIAYILACVLDAMSPYLAVCQAVSMHQVVYRLPITIKHPDLFSLTVVCCQGKDRGGCSARGGQHGSGGPGAGSSGAACGCCMHRPCPTGGEHAPADATVLGCTS